MTVGARPIDLSSSEPKVATSTAQTRFRPDIQGLRAVAVATVVLNHAQVSWLPGGYVGVDVFFVISGYLITQLLLRDAQNDRGISLSRFYSRRARRILPAATIVMIATAVASVALLGYVRAKSILVDEVWCAFFAANNRFSHLGTDYFAADAPPSPVQHFWSLAVEEQFYLVWPLLLIVVMAMATNRRRADRPVAISIGLIGGASLAWCVVLTQHQPVAAYFSTAARAWELGLGAACAVLAHRIARWPTAVAVPLGWVGLGMIICASVAFSDRTPFPGYAALVPTLGTALVVIAGEGPGLAGPSGVLGLSWFQHVGDWSYSLYLWHWPILVLAAGYAGHELVLWQDLALVGLAVLVSAFTYRFVENPFRRSRLLSRKAWRGIAVYPLATALTLLVIGAGNAAIDRELQERTRAPVITVRHYGHDDPGASFSKNQTIALVQASAEAARAGVPIPGNLEPNLLDLQGDVAPVGACDYSADSRELCPRGDPSGQGALVVLGDSHARAWIPALDEIATREHLKAYYFVKSGCNAAMIAPSFGQGAFTGCVDFRTWAIEQIRQLGPAIVFIASDLPPAYMDPRRGYVDDPEQVAAAVQDGLVVTIDEISPSAGAVYVVGDPPGVAEPPGDCLSRRGANLGDCAYGRSSRSRLIYQAERAAARAGGADFIATLRWFCADGVCPSVVGSTVTYRDTEHITTHYASVLAPELQAALAPTRGRGPVTGIGKDEEERSGP